MRKILMIGSLALTIILSAELASSTPVHPARKVVGKTVITTVTTTTQPIRNTIKDIRDHLKNHGPLRSLRNTLRSLFNRNTTPDPDVKEVTE